MPWSANLDALLGEIDRSLRGAAKRVRGALGDDPLEILCYRGFGTRRSIIAPGRVVERRRVAPSTDADSLVRNLLNTFRRLDSDPVPFARVAVGHSGGSAIVAADDEGFFEATVEPATHAADVPEWSSCRVELLSPTHAGGAVSTSGEILIPPASARFGVISDIDDTVIQSRVSSFLLAARTLLAENARTRLPFPGVAAFYSALRNGATGRECNPVFYVSSGPWNIHDVITEFMELQGLPRGPIVLRDWDIAFGALASARHFEHKGGAIRRILRTYPELPFMLIGDTSQHDPEIYHAIVGEFPGRIHAIYIREVTRREGRSVAVRALAEEVRAHGCALVLSEDTLGAAVHAAEQGWISPDALPLVREEKLADEGVTSGKVDVPGGGKPPEG